MSRQSDFYSAVYDRAVALGANDVQARLAAAQASQETGYGQHYVGGNLFGIKASEDYAGQSVTAGTSEEYDGQMVRETAKFRAYENPLDSVKDYLSTIQTNFPDAWNAPTFSEAVQGLKTGVFGSYATDSKYGSKLTAIDKQIGGTAYAANPENVPIPHSPNAFTDLAGVPDDVVPVADPNFAPIDREFAYAEDPANVPTPTVPSQRSDVASFSEAPAQNSGLLTPYAPTDEPSHWGLNPDVAPVPVPTFNQWDAVAAATPIQAPVEQDQTAGLLSAPADLGSFPGGLLAARETLTQRDPVPTTNNFADLAAAGPMGGDFAAPEDRFAGAGPSTAQPFDRFVQTSSIPTEVDPNSYLPGTAPLVDTRAVPANRVQSVSITPETAGLLSPPTNTQPITQADISRAFLNPTGINEFDPSFTEGLMSAQNPVTPFAVETTSYTPGTETEAEIASSRFSTPAKTSRIGQEQPFDAARMPGLIDPATSTAGLLSQPADIGGFLAATAAQRGPTSGILSAEHQMVQRDAERALAEAQQEQQARLATVAPPATPQQQAAGYQEFAGLATPAGITNLSGHTLVGPAGTPTSNFLAPAVEEETAPALDTVEVADQPSIATIDGPANTPAVDQQQRITAPATQTVARRTPTVTQSQPSFADKVKGFLNPGTSIGTTIGGFLGLPGAIAGGFLGNAAYQGLQSQSQPMAINNIGAGADNVYSVWSGGQPPGTQATASDGQTVTALDNGMTAVTNKWGTSTAFDKNGKAYAYFGPSLTNIEGEGSDVEGSGGGTPGFL